MKHKAIEIWVGLFMLAGILAMAFLAYQVSAVSTGSAEVYTITAQFENVGGLNPKAPVSIGGVRIGRVTDIHIDQRSYKAVVTMEIDQLYNELPIDTSAAILTSGLLGAQFVGLEPGGDDLFLADGDDVELTQSTIQLENMIGQFMFNTAGKTK